MLEVVTRDVVVMLQRNNLEVLAWTVNDVNDLKRLLEYGVDGIITDYPKEMKEYINVRRWDVVKKR